MFDQRHLLSTSYGPKASVLPVSILSPHITRHSKACHGNEHNRLIGEGHLTFQTSKLLWEAVGLPDASFFELRPLTFNMALVSVKSTRCYVCVCVC